MGEALTAQRHDYASYDGLLEDYFERGWTDGLPIVPPTPEKVAAFLDAASLMPGDVLGEVPTREVVVTAEQVAINAVMAGCRPEYMPAVASAVRAHLHEKGNCHSTTGTLSGAAQCVILNGPVRSEIGVQCREGCFGPGFRANATLGRALRLVVRNVCRGIPGVLDRASFSNTMRYSFCFGEDEEDSSWVPMHVERGFDAQDSAVTVASVMSLVEAVDFTSRTPEAICDTLVREIQSRFIASDRWLGDDTNLVCVIGPEHRRFFDREGWSKDDIRGYLWPRLFVDGGPGMGLGKPEGLLLVAAGGDGMASSWLLFPHLAWAITESIRDRRKA